MKRGRSVVLSPKILESLSLLQDGLNAMIDPSWRSVRSLDNWGLAITMESCELLDSYPWKWWKNINAKPDINNIRIELVDILHFALSGMIQINSMKSENVPAVFRLPLSESCRPMLAPASATSSIQDMFFFPLELSTNAVPTFRNVIQLANAYRFDIITEGIIASADDLDFNLVAYYVAKHTLNCIRQLGGYKDGSYAKVTQGMEDNEFLHDCIKGLTVEDVVDEERYMEVWNGIMTKVYNAFNVAECDQKNVAHWVNMALRDRDAVKQSE